MAYPINEFNMVEDVKIKIAPIQSGSGDPSPENIRPISGWDAVNVYVSPTTDAEDGDTYPISLGQTVYGGTLDVTSGELTIDHQKWTCAGVGSLGSGNLFNKGSTTAYNVYYTFSTATTPLAPLSKQTDVKCSHFPYASNQTTPNTCTVASSQFRVVLDKDDERNTASLFNAWVAEQYNNGTPLEFVAKLAEPITVQLTPTEVRTLLGENNIWADSGSVEVTFANGTTETGDVVTFEGLNLKDAFLAEHRQVARLTVTPLSGSAITLTEANIVQGSFVIDRASTTGDTFELGGCIASELSFSVYNEEGTYNNFAWSGATIKAEIGVVDDDDTVIGYIPMGYYIIDTVPKVRDVIQISALDRMVKFDKVVPLSSFMSWAVNKTVKQYVQRICSQCGVTLATDITGFNNTKYVIPTPPSEDGMTYRQLLLWCCQLMGKQGYMDWNGQLQIDSTPVLPDDNATSIVGDAVVGYAIVGYPKASGLGVDIENVSETERFSSDYEDYTVQITGIVYSDDDGTDWLYGSEDYVIDLTGNPLIQDPNYLLPYIGASIMGVPYTPFTATTIPYPYLFPGDWVAYIVNGTSHYGILTNVTFKMNAHNVLESAGESEQSNSYADVGVSATAKHYTQVADKKLEKRIELEADRISLVASDVNILGQQIQLKVDSNGVVSAINLSEEGVRIDANKLNINGVISANGNFEVDTNGNLTASNATISGAITATSLSLGNGVTIPYSKVSNAPDLTVYVQKDGTIGSTPASGVTGFKVSSAGLLTASNAVIYGTLYASAGTIGGFTMDSNSIHTTNVAITSNASNSVGLSSSTFTRTIGGTSRSNLKFAIGSKFGVANDGTVYANDGVFSGAITSSNATITGGTVNIATANATDDVIELNYSPYSTKICPRYLYTGANDYFAYVGYTGGAVGFYYKEPNKNYYSGYMNKNGIGTEYSITCDVGTIANVATLSYTVVSTF